MPMRGQRTDLSDLPSPEPERPTKAWGWLASLGLGIVAAVTGQIPALAALSLFHERGLGLAKLQGLERDAVAVIILICVSTPVQVGLLFWFARRKVASAFGYLALTRLSQLGQAGGEFWGWEGVKSESVQRWGFEIRL